MHMLGWLTPNSPPADFICRRLRIPNNEAWLSIVSGCLLALTKEKNFEAFGTASPEDTAAKFAIMFDEFSLTGYCHMIGEIILWPSATANPPGYGIADVGDILLCNGDEITQTLYPTLYTLLGTTYGAAASGKFKIPDTRGRMIKHRRVDNSDAVGNTAGAETHTLSSGEMPAHTHVYTAAVAAGAAAPGPLPISVPLATVTGSTGGGAAHNNMPPYMVMRYFIQAR